MAINVLSEEIFNKISAGEVVERPASIVKELFENAIDAGADKITIEITDGGLKEIIITDNGCGIEFDDIEKAFMPHATSKIEKVEDLENIASLGFRGEALASIASVSQVEMVSKTENEEFGAKIALSGGKKLEKLQVGAERGTRIVVKNLFFNTPARLKFLKKPKSEEGEITHLVAKLILANPTISIRYMANNQVVYNTFGNGLAEALYIVYGKEVYDNLVEVNMESGDLSIFGYIAKPTICKSNRSYGTLFVNNRLVNNYMIFSAITDALDGYLMKGKFPIFALNIKLPFDDVDVNVHPSKQEVKFANPGRIYGFVSNAIFKAVAAVNYIAPLTVEEPQMVEEAASTSLNKISPSEGASFNFIFNNSNEDKFNDKPNKLVEIIVENEIKPGYVKEEIKQEQIIEKQETIEKVFDNYKIVGTMLNTYIIIEKGDRIYILDQHAGHERVLYDKIIQEVSRNEVVKQNLFFPIQIKLNEKEKNFIVENEAKLKNFGFSLSLMENTLNIFAIPYLLVGMSVENFFADVLKNLDSFVGQPISYINEKFTQKACKAAIKAGDVLTEEEIEVLIEKFIEGGHVLLCPHGRPIAIEISKTELEKMFKRIV